MARDGRQGLLPSRSEEVPRFGRRGSAVRCPAVLWPVVALLAASWVAGCESEEGPEEQAPMAQQKAAKGQASKKEAAEAESEEEFVYTYNAVGKRDPFRTYFAELEEEERSAHKLTELQKYEIDQLKLVAVVVGTATPMAMVEDPTGKGHVVKVGTLIGKHWGQVKHIRRGEIIIQEEFRDFTGRRVTHLVPMRLPEDKKVSLK